MSAIKQYTSQEAAEYLGIKLDRLRKLAQQEVIPSIQIGERGPRLFELRALDKFKLTLQGQSCK